MSEVTLNIGKMHRFTGKNMPMFLIKTMPEPDSYFKNGDMVVILEAHPKIFLMKVLTSDGTVGFVPYLPKLWEEV